METKKLDKPQSQEKPKHEGKALVAPGAFEHSLEPQNMEQTMNLAKMLATSDIVPKDFIGKPANIVVAITLGREVGFGWAQALQNICVINGRPSIWGDGAIGLVLDSNLLEFKEDSFDPAKDGGTATFTCKRKGLPPTTRTFSHEDAKKADLLKKDTYQKYEKRMLFNRARAFALRDDFADVLKGLRIAEEENDIIDLKPTGEGAYAMPKRASEATKTPQEPPSGEEGAGGDGEPKEPAKGKDGPQTDEKTGIGSVTFVPGTLGSRKHGGKTVYIVHSKDGDMKFLSNEESVCLFAKKAKDEGSWVKVDFERVGDDLWVLSIDRTQA